jgi:UDP-glucose 4-epimerase
MATVLVTGATGFVGSAVLTKLQQLGHAVITLGRTAPREPGPLVHLPADLDEPATILAHRHDLQSVELAAHIGGEVLRTGDPAADDMVRAMRTNVLGTAHLLAALPPSLCSLCYTSSLDVYRPTHVRPVSEDDPPGPVTYYGASKLAAESLLRVWSVRQGIPLAVLRLSQVYGPGDSSAKAIPNFLRACLGGDPPVLRGDGSDLRDYLYVDDAAAAVVRALERRATGIFNIASGVGTSISDLLAAVRLAAHSSIEPTWLPATRSPSTMVLDVRRARAVLGWEPQVTLAEGLERTAAALTNQSSRR